MLCKPASAQQQTERFSTLHPGNELDEQESQYLEQLREDLDRYLKDLRKILDDNHKRLRDQNADRQYRQRLDELQGWIREHFETLIEEETPSAALLDCWALAARLSDYARSDELERAFDNHAPTVREGLLGIEQRLYWLLVRHLPVEHRQHLDSRIDEYVRQNPLRDQDRDSGGFFDFGTSVFSVVSTGKDALGYLSQIPLMPVNIASGVRQSGQGLQDINLTAQEFVRAVENMPAEMRVQIEQLIHTLSQNQTELAQLLRDFESASLELRQSLVQADRLSTGIQANIQSGQPLAESLERLSANVLEATRETNRLMGSIEGLRQNDRPSTGPGFQIDDYSQAAQRIETAAAEIRAMLGEIRALRGDDQPASATRAAKASPQGRPFDIREYDQTARSIEAGAAELRRLLEAFNDSIAQLSATTQDQQARQRRLQAAMHNIAAPLRGLLYQAALLGAALLLLAAGLAGLLLRRHRPPPQKP